MQRTATPISSIDAAIGWVAQRERSVRHALRLRQETARLENALLRGLRPVVVYSPQKTGSTAASTALERHPELIISKVHTLVRQHDWDGNLRHRVHPDGSILIGSHYAEATRRVILESQRPAQFVVTLREPVATNLSWFAFTAHRIWLRDQRTSMATLDGPALARLFLERFPHDCVSVWPRVELSVALEFDPYATAFPHAQGWGRVQAGARDVLIMRADLSDSAKAHALQQFTWIPNITVTRARESGSGTDGIYARLKSAIHAHPKYIRTMLDTQFARHFWSAAELAAIEARWLESR